MSYVDGFVLPVPKDKMDAYKALAEKVGPIWIEHGALQYMECWGDDLEDNGFSLTFPQMVEPKEGETVVFSYIVYKSREHRDEVNAKVMADTRMKDGDKMPDMPFDCKRMAYGGFKTIVNLG